MRQFSIKNVQAAELLDKITELTGQGKTEVVIRALELYQTSLLAGREAEAIVRSIHEGVHPYLKPEYRGKAPSKEEIEAELGMP